MELKDKIKEAFDNYGISNMKYQGVQYHISKKGDTIVDAVRIHGCYSSVGATYDRFAKANDAVEPERVGIVLKNHMRKDKPVYGQGTRLLVKELTSPTYNGRFKEYIDKAAAEFKLTLPELAEYMLNVGLIIPTGYFTVKPKLEIMALAMAFRETYSFYGTALTLANLYPPKTFKEWIIYSLLGYNLSNYLSYKRLYRGHGTFCPTQLPKNVYNFFMGSNKIKFKETQYTKPFSKEYYWDNGGDVVYQYIGNNALDTKYWEEALKPLKEFARRDYRNPEGIHPQYWQGLVSEEKITDSDEVKELRKKFKLTLKGIVDKCVESLE